MPAQHTVFVDESFYEWFGLPRPESNFCYAALSLPTDRLPQLEKFSAALQEFCDECLVRHGVVRRNPHEVKSTDVRRLPPADIDAIAQKIAWFLRKNRGVIFGFFVPAEGYFHYKLRSDFIDRAAELTALPEAERLTRTTAIRAELLVEWEESVGDVGLLEELHKMLFGFLFQYHGEVLRRTFNIVYDSRQPEEDSELHLRSEDFGRLTAKVDGNLVGYYQGFSGEFSHQNPGLRLVDLVVGDLRAFFYRHPEVVAAESRLEVLSPYLNPQMKLIGGRAPFYAKKLPEDVSRCFDATGAGFMLPRLKDYFANGNLTYFAKFGEARHLSLPTRTIFDMAD